MRPVEGFQFEPALLREAAELVGDKQELEASG